MVKSLIPVRWTRGRGNIMPRLAGSFNTRAHTPPGKGPEKKQTHKMVEFSGPESTYHHRPTTRFALLNARAAKVDMGLP